MTPAQAGIQALPRVLTANEFAVDADLWVGSSIIALGYPEFLGTGNIKWLSRAFARQGIISWVDLQSPSSDVVIVDGQITPGNSGGPIFTVPSGSDRFGNFVVGARMKFVGIVSATIIPQQGFVGIGIVEPAARVEKMLSSASIKLGAGKAGP